MTRLTNRILEAIAHMSAIASSNGQEGDYQEADMDAMDKAGDWAAEEYAKRKLRNAQRQKVSKP